MKLAILIDFGSISSIFVQLAQFDWVGNYWSSPESSPDTILALQARMVRWQGCVAGGEPSEFEMVNPSEFEKVTPSEG